MTAGCIPGEGTDQALCGLGNRYRTINPIVLVSACPDGVARVVLGRRGKLPPDYRDRVGRSFQAVLTEIWDRQGGVYTSRH